MDWLKELLKGMQLSEEQIKQITEGVEGNYKGYVPEHRFKEVNDAKKSLETTLKERDQQLTDLKKSAEGNETLQTKIKELEDANKQAADKYQTELKELRTNTALKLALNGKVHDPDLVSSLLDKTKIELDDAGNVKAGFDDQLKALQESKAFLFVPEDKGGFQFRGFQPADATGGGGGQQPNIGKQLADQNKQSNEALQQAQANYFK
ncbi:phage scaffolding protein [Brevibacillus sp. M2.1A]|uniref:phage scaffolding protein n=1 Tax=Brevibacillus sp. M2.1A TaxID=2738980 RepID=UPI00156AE8C5|nr:phage scaffolding protein [Brevibacillus sp. M2.1A]MCC8435471.1 phage scaffolding protein [Brevibacillus sp. M2.1A]